MYGGGFGSRHDRFGDELLGGLKQQSADQADQNSFYDNNNTQEKSKKRKKQPQ